MRPTRRTFAPYVLALVSAAVLVACQDDARPRQADGPTLEVAPPTPSATAAPPPTATALPPEPGLGERLRYEGEFERAIEVFAQVVEETSGAEQQQARLAHAQLLVHTGRPEDARPVLEAQVAEAPPSIAEGGPAQFLLADTLRDLGETELAVAAYERYIGAGGTLGEFAAAERAKLLAALGRTAEAEQGAAGVMQGGLIDEFRATFAHEMGAAYAEAGDDTRAVGWYERSLATPDATPSATLPALGRAKKRLGDGAWTRHYLDAITRYPARSFATELIGELDAAGAPVSAYLRGLVAYRGYRNGEARQALSAAVAQGDHPGEATYYLAALDERAGDVDAAIDTYLRAHETDRASAQADDALWWRGRMLEVADRLDEASESYARLAREYPSSEWQADAAFRSGLVLYKDGDYGEAAAAWAGVAAGETEDAARARFWQARALIEDGDDRGEAMLEAIAGDPAEEGKFYALRAEVLLGRNIEDDPGGGGTGAPDLDAVARYIAQVTRTDPSTPKPPADPAWPQVAELMAAERDRDAELLARSLIEGADETPVSLYHDLEALVSLGDESLTARAASLLLATLPEPAPGAPPIPEDLLRLAYPLAYGDLAEDAAEDEDVDPLLLLALVRQESYYDPDAGSSAGALGLTQVIPTTGQSIADSLGVDDFDTADLFRPKVSLRFGANYIGSQLREFDGNEYHALAAYNGGPGTASNAIDLAGDDIDLFVEELEFDETRLYVRLVMENYARYRQLYGGIDRASLPE